MPELNTKQFWKSNPNQMALPGMEEHAHPGATALTQGYHFKSNYHPSTGGADLTARHPDWGDHDVATLAWQTDKSFRGAGLHQGEIGWVHTEPNHQGQGLATALYGVGRTMAKIKPQHSTDRTEDGDAFAAKSAKKYGGRVPKNKYHSGR